MQTPPSSPLIVVSGNSSGKLPLQRVMLEVHLGKHIPSFKNHKRAIIDSNTGKMRTSTQKDIKKRMNSLEDAIVSALFSWCQTTESATPLECSKQLRTLLSGLCDDSIREIPCGSWDVLYVPKGQEGIAITIERIQ